jgi:hypothetical protein
MEKDAVLEPMEVRFTEPADVEKYGAAWHRYDELALISLPARELIKLESEIGSPLIDVMRGFRRDSGFGLLAASWLAVRTVPFDQFNPVVMLAEWRIAEKDVDAGKGSDPDVSTDTPSTTPKPDTVVLTNLLP